MRELHGPLRLRADREPRVCNAQRGDTWKNVRFNFGSKPKPTGKGNEIAAYNGVTSGNGHLTGKRAEVAAQAS